VSLKIPLAVKRSTLERCDSNHCQITCSNSETNGTRKRRIILTFSLFNRASCTYVVTARSSDSKMENQNHFSSKERILERLPGRYYTDVHIRRVSQRYVLDLPYTIPHSPLKQTFYNIPFIVELRKLYTKYKFDK